MHVNSVVALLAIMSVPILAFGQAQGEISLDRTRGAFQKWLNATGLSEQFELNRVRFTSPTPDVTEKVLELDLRFKTAGTNAKEEQERFRSLLEEYQRSNNVFLPAKLFYKLLFFSGVEERRAVVRIRVMENSVEVRLDPKSLTLVVEGTVNRNIVERSLQLAGGPEGQELKLPPARLNRLAEELEDFFVKRFTEANKEAGLEQPSFARAPRSPMHLNLIVTGVKKQAMKQQNFWEKLQLIVHVTRLEEGAVQMHLYVDGHYAPGIGKRLPDDRAYDTHPIDALQLNAFADGLMRDIQDLLRQ